MVGKQKLILSRFLEEKSTLFLFKVSQKTQGDIGEGVGEGLEGCFKHTCE